MLLLLLVSLLVASADGFKYSSRKLNKFSLKMGSYEDMLARAKAEKAAKTSGGASAPLSSTSQSKPAVSSSPTSAQILPPKPKVVAKSNNNLPFSDDMYDHLKFVIERLTARMKGDKPLSVTEMRKFEAAVSAIIDDLGLEGTAPPKVQPVVKQPQQQQAPPVLKQQLQQPTRPVTTPKSKVDPSKVVVYEQGEEPAGYLGQDFDPNSPYAPLFGKKDYWTVDDMENLSTEEFYRRVNERNSEMKRRRKALGEPMGTAAYEDYQEYLKKKSQELIDAREEQEKIEKGN